MGEERKVYRILVGMPEGNTSLGRLRRRREDGISGFYCDLFGGGG
jgi:hypothetical protein